MAVRKIPGRGKAGSRERGEGREGKAPNTKIHRNPTQSSLNKVNRACKTGFRAEKFNQGAAVAPPDPPSSDFGAASHDEFG